MNQIRDWAISLDHWSLTVVIIAILGLGVMCTVLVRAFLSHRAIKFDLRIWKNGEDKEDG